MKTDETWGGGWNDCRQNQRERRNMTLSRSQRVRRSTMKAMASDGSDERGVMVEAMLNSRIIIVDRPQMIKPSTLVLWY